MKSTFFVFILALVTALGVPHARSTLRIWEISKRIAARIARQ